MNLASLTPTLVRWFDPRTPQGKLNWQLDINTTMIGFLILWGDQPWLAFAALGGLFTLTVLLQGRNLGVLMLLYGISGWAGEAAIVALGQVWAFRVPTHTVLEGGLLGVPFYMVFGWAMVGALMVALLRLFGPKT